jgi:CrcB protein
MTPTETQEVIVRNVVAIAVAGALGVLARHAVQVLVPRAAGLPWGTFVVNVTGALAIGFIAAAAVHGLPMPLWLQETLTVGFLGGFTTFSALSLETVTLLDRGRVVAAAGYSLGSLAAGVAAVIVGSGWAASPSGGDACGPPAQVRGRDRAAWVSFSVPPTGSVGRGDALTPTVSQEVPWWASSPKRVARSRRCSVRPRPPRSG